MSPTELTTAASLAPSEASGDRLYALLPAVYRVRDAAHGQQLRALLRVIGRELQVLDEDIERLYDNWFVETCAEWVVPYLGDLLGVTRERDQARAVLPAAADRRRGRTHLDLVARRDFAGLRRICGVDDADLADGDGGNALGRALGTRRRRRRGTRFRMPDFGQT